MTSQPSRQEVLRWKRFVFNEQVYDLSHLDAHWVEYQDNREGREANSYKFKVTYGSHCFTKEDPNLSEAESSLWIYKAPKEDRHFNIARYNLSKQLPSIIRSLGETDTLVFFAGYGNFATVKVIDFEGVKTDYFVVFRVFRENRAFRLHVESAYPRERGKVKKVSFFAIASNLLKGKDLPKPRK
ncbi:MAG: heat-shock protein [Snowella sp.]|nr:MAG: heat-shock protein [Snowella sp.]